MRAPADVTGTLNPQPAGAGPVLLLHCSAGSGRQWEGLVRALEGDRYAIAPDLYGYGEAGPWPGPGPITLSAEAARAVDAVAAEAEPLDVVGHSYGGAVALRLAMEQARRIRSLTLIEPVAFHVLRHGPARDRRLLGSVHRIAAAMIEGVLSGDYQAAMQCFVDYWNGDGAWAATDPAARRRIARHAPKIVLDFHAAINEETTPAEYGGAFSFPVRIMRGNRSPEPARRVAELLGEHIPGARLVTVAGAGHMLPLSHPAETLAVVREQLHGNPQAVSEAA